jgi:hypothetical protein
LNGFSVRRNDKKTNHLHDVWYRETERFTPRDQLSLPYALWKTGIEFETIRGPQIKESYAIVNNAHDSTPYNTREIG